MGREETVQADDVALHCRIDETAADAPWIVFINSLATDLTVWDAQVAALADEWRILRYDQRGHGRSEIGAGPLNFDILAGDLAALMDHFKIPRCICVGLSMGVPTALALHRRDPALLSGLVVVDGMAKTAPTGAANWAERIAAAKAGGMDHVADVTVERWLQQDSAAGPKGPRLRAMIAGTALAGYTQCAGALQGYDYAADLARLSCPLHAIAGACDGAIAETMEKVFGPVAAASVHQIPQAGHLPNFERPEMFNPVLRDCLEAMR